MSETESEKRERQWEKRGRDRVRTDGEKRGR